MPLQELNMRLLSIDPGYSTGIALVDTTDNWVYLKTYKFDAFIPEFKLMGFTAFHHIIFENIPMNTNNREQVQLLSVIARWITKQDVLFESISPGHWKPLAKARRWAHPKAFTQHERDAYNMARFYLLVRHKMDIGVLPCKDPTTF